MDYLKQKSKHNTIICLSFLFAALTFVGCAGGKSAQKLPTPLTTENPTPTPTPKGWLDSLRKEGWIDISQDWSETDTSNLENYLKYPVSTSRTVQLGDFEYTLTLPKTVYRLSDLQNGIDTIEITATLRYTGDKERVTIFARDSVFYLSGITDTYDGWEGGGSYDIGAEHVITKEKSITFTRVYEEYSKSIVGPGPGLIILGAEFSVADENGNDTDEAYDFLLSIPYDVLE